MPFTAKYNNEFLDALDRETFIVGLRRRLHQNPMYLPPPSPPMNSYFNTIPFTVRKAIEDEAFQESLRRENHLFFPRPPPMNNNTISYNNYSSFGSPSCDFYRGDGNTYSPTENNHEYIERNNNKIKKTTDAANSARPSNLHYAANSARPRNLYYTADSTPRNGLNYGATRNIITSIRFPPVTNLKNTAAASPKKTTIRYKLRIPLSPIDINMNINSDLIPEHVRRALVVEYVNTDPNVPVENRLRRCYSL